MTTFVAASIGPFMIAIVLVPLVLVAANGRILDPSLIIGVLVITFSPVIAIMPSTAVLMLCLSAFAKLRVGSVLSGPSV